MRSALEGLKRIRQRTLRGAHPLLTDGRAISTAVARSSEKGKRTSWYSTGAVTSSGTHFAVISPAKSLRASIT
jgi:hypothetical protein